MTSAPVLVKEAAPAPSRIGRFLFECKWIAGAAAAFHLAYEIPALALLMVFYLYALVRLTEAATSRRAFYSGSTVGMVTFGPQLWFFVNIFHFAAPGLWLLLSIWPGLFVLVGRSLRRISGIRRWAWMLALPVLWTGMEYFRSELYYLRFSWLTPGIAMSGSAGGGSLLVELIGVYGAGFLLMLVAAWWACWPWRWAMALTLLLLLLVLIAALLPPRVSAKVKARNPAQVVGVQLEGAMPNEVLSALNHALAAYPDAPLFVMSEY